MIDRRRVRLAGRSWWGAGAVATALVASALAAPPAGAAPAGVSCGQTLTADTTLAADLRCANGPGILLASGVVLDLGGHALIGPGSSGEGIAAAPLSTGGNTIRNGTIRNWQVGVHQTADADGLTPSALSDVRLSNAPVVNDSPGVALDLRRVNAVDSAINANFGNLTVTGSRLTRSPITTFNAFSTVTSSTLIASTVSISSAGSMTVESSTLDGRGTTDLAWLSETGITIRNSVVRNYAQPIRGYYSGATLINSTFTDMPNGVVGGVAPAVMPGPIPVTATGNKFVRSGVALRGDVPMAVESNTFVNNRTAVEFTYEAEEPGGTDPYSRALNNVVTGSTGSGIVAHLPGVAIGGNTAKRNGGYGIDAPGAVDRGGNVASGNGAGQCVGVVCARR